MSKILPLRCQIGESKNLILINLTFIEKLLQSHQPYYLIHSDDKLSNYKKTRNAFGMAGSTG
jgi:hypothetical protein